MALLDMARINLKHIEVAHVNFHKRDTALRDEKIVRNYCKKYGIKFHIMNFKPEEVRSNFQAEARISRYRFFKTICDKNNLNSVLVAHHKDDLIETYFMQVDKKLSVNYYGLAESINLYGVNVYRPLLDYTKSDLVEYCTSNEIEYGIDESNNSDCYERNRVRHNRVDHLSLDEKNIIVAEINRLNVSEKKKADKALEFLKSKQDFTVSEFTLMPYIKKGLSIIYGAKSDKFFNEVLRQLKESSSYLYEGNEYWLSKEYGKIHLFKKPREYKYVFNSIEELNSFSCEFFKVRKKGNSRQCVSITKNDFPIVIRNVDNKDTIEMMYGKKKLNRFFIDNKILIKDRCEWPIVINKKSIAILVPELGCNTDHYSLKPSFYVIKL